MTTITWYFDFISPYAWLQSTQLQALRLRAAKQQPAIVYKPILFAGLLKHWGQKGPAEMATKRIYTYQQVAWYAKQAGLTLHWPARHPFNPLPLLRLCALLGSDAAIADRLFAWVWQDGHLPDEPGPWSGLLAELGVKAADLDAPRVKDEIRLNTEEALGKGIFGVPSMIISSAQGNTQASTAPRLSPIFWGFDATPMAEAWLAGDAFFDSPEYLGASLVGDGIVRKSSS